MSSMKSCGEQNWWSQVHHASSSERPDPSRAENPSEQILTVAALLLQISAGGCVANGCTYTHNQTQTRRQARISVLIQDNISTQHHAHTKKSPRPSMVILWSVLRAHPSYCFVLIWPPFFYFFSFSFTYLLAFLLPLYVFQKQTNAMQICVIASLTW